MSLHELSLARANLPQIPGATLTEQLMNGRQLAGAALRKYVPDFAFDPGKADALLEKIDAWEERNQKTLEKSMADPSANAIPKAICLSFGSDTARAFVIATYTHAAYMLGPWVSGAVEREAELGEVITDRWARDDAEARLQAFASIVKMEQDGYLKTLFVPEGPQSSCTGLGAPIPPVIVWGIVVLLVAVVAGLLLLLYSYQSLKLNNRLMTELCERAEKRGEQATVRRCVELAADLQKPPGSGLADTLTKIAIGAGVLYVGITFGPALLGKLFGGKK